jgi:hypothetical protein
MISFLVFFLFSKKHAKEDEKNSHLSFCEINLNTFIEILEKFSTPPPPRQLPPLARGFGGFSVNSLNEKRNM